MGSFGRAVVFRFQGVEQVLLLRRRCHAHGIPQGGAARFSEAAKCIGLGQECVTDVGRDRCGVKIAQRYERPRGPGGHNGLGRRLVQPDDHPKAEPHGLVPSMVQSHSLIIDIHRPNFDPVPPSVLHELGGGVKAHRLAVDDRRAKLGGIVMLQPCRNINQQGETGRMRFRKAVLSKTSNLLKHLLGELAFQPVAFHPVNSFWRNWSITPGRRQAPIARRS